jgi:hypothetical protein
MQWTSTLESPTRYHLWSALTCAGHVLGRNVWMVRMGKWCVFPGQLLTVLVGPTAVKKDTAMSQAVNLMRALPGPAVNILPKRTSPQALLDQLAACGPRPNVGFIYASEMGTFFSNESFMDGMVTMVTDLWNAPTGAIDSRTMHFASHEERIVFKGWKATLRDYAIGGLMAITPEGVATELPASAKKRGFMGRCVWVYAGTTDRPPNPGTRWNEEEPQERDALLEGLERLATLAGPIWFTKPSREWFEDWYTNVHTPSVAQSAAEAQETGYLGRKADHLLRVAIILACINHVSGEQPFEVRTDNLKRALHLLVQTEKELPRVIDEVGRAPAGEKMAALLRFLDSGPKRKIRVQQYMWKKGVLGDDFRRLLDYAIEIKSVKLEDNGKTIWLSRATSSGQKLRSIADD